MVRPVLPDAAVVAGTNEPDRIAPANLAALLRRGQHVPMAIDEPTARLIAEFAAADPKPLHEGSPEEGRAAMAALRDLYGPGSDVADVHDQEIDTLDGARIDLRVIVPDEDPTAVLVYFHGGGWVLGALDEFETLGRDLARSTRAAVVLVDYRLAPEHRYPTAVEDAWTALRWVAANVAAIAGRVVPIVVGGDSSGGSLATVVARRATMTGGPAIAAQVLVYPVCDADTETPSYLDAENQLLISRDSMIWFWDHYAPDVASRAEPDASPLRAADLSGLPPAIVLTAEHDVLRDEGHAYVDRLRAAGVPVEHRCFAGQMHGFFTMRNLLATSDEGIAYIAEHLRRHLDDHLMRSTTRSANV